MDDVSLTFLGFNALSPQLPPGAPANANSVASAIDTFVNNGGTVPAGFSGLYTLSGSALVSALQQLAGEAGASGGVQGGTQLTNSFLSLLTNGFFNSQGPFVGFSPSASGYAAEPRMSPAAAAAYAALDRATGNASQFDKRWNVWGSTYGGQANASGDATAGTSDTKARSFGVAAGVDYRLTPDRIVGFALAGGGTNWSLANAMGGGNSDAFQMGVYGAQRFGASYVSGALSYAWHRMSTSRTVTISGTDTLAAGFSANNFAVRLETGHRFAKGVFGITPYAALQTQAFYLPSYSESATSGSSQFALAYSSRTATDTRSEAGVWLDTKQFIGAGNVNLFSRLAWAHDWRSDASVTAAFQTLAGSSFIVSGAAAPKNVALVTGGAEVALNKNTTVSAKFDGEFGTGYSSYGGTARLRYAWN